MAAAQTPTISGNHAMWYLGGVASDGGYYATQVLTANPNGLTGTITWSSAGSGSGSIGLSCYTSCSTTVTVTSYDASGGCTADLVVYVTIGGVQSPTFSITVVSPTTTTLQPGYPIDRTYNVGNLSEYDWNLTDSCGYSDAGLDQNEAFGTWTYDYSGEDWPLPSLGPTYDSSSILYDFTGNGGINSGTIPTPEPPQTPLTTTKVFEDAPWRLFVGSQTSTAGVQVHSDTQVWYQDHGRHQ